MTVRMLLSAAFLLLILAFLLLTQPHPTQPVGTTPGTTPFAHPYSLQTTVSGAYLQPAVNVVQQPARADSVNDR